MCHSISAHVGGILKGSSNTKNKVSTMLIYMLLKPVYQNIVQPNYELRNWSSLYAKIHQLFVLFWEIIYNADSSLEQFTSMHKRSTAHTLLSSLCTV